MKETSRKYYGFDNRYEYTMNLQCSSNKSSSEYAVKHCVAKAPDHILKTIIPH